ncbi:GntR family transcriptional regulator [Nonomuraea pusilla]|nr:GntR family transcriptional regulator [Nonomuraea pusilla]
MHDDGVRGRGLHGQTVEAIAAMIFGGEVREGDSLDVSALQARLGVSSTALREAMKVLGDAPHGGDLDALRARARAFRDRVRGLTAEEPAV